MYFSATTFFPARIETTIGNVGTSEFKYNIKKKSQNLPLYLLYWKIRLICFQLWTITFENQLIHNYVRRNDIRYQLLSTNQR